MDNDQILYETFGELLLLPEPVFKALRKNFTELKSDGKYFYDCNDFYLYCAQESQMPLSNIIHRTYIDRELDKLKNKGKSHIIKKQVMFHVKHS